MTNTILKEKLDDCIDFVLTDDGSVGLYNHEVEDIYHSSYGARNEAREKFIEPLDFETNFLKNKKLKVLDICFGIGYNTKALLNKLVECDYKGSVEIDALEYDKKLILLSPFVEDGFKNNIPSFLLLNIMQKEIIKDKELLNKYLNAESKNYFMKPLLFNFFKKEAFLEGNYNPVNKLNSFLHNIYYHCISRRYKKRLKPSILKNFTFNAHFDDARNTIKLIQGDYDIIFLDAFTPVKLPTLWSLQFFIKLYSLISPDGLLVTYSNSAAVRHAMLEAGFYVGKTYDRKNKPSGTIASKNKKLITHPLEEYDLGLIKTNAGVYFLDENLENQPYEILNEREERKTKLNLESSSRYIKNFKRKDKCNV